MYSKDKKNMVGTRLSDVDYQFLERMSHRFNLSIAECIRIIVGEYRRSRVPQGTAQNKKVGDSVGDK